MNKDASYQLPIQIPFLIRPLSAHCAPIVFQSICFLNDSFAPFCSDERTSHAYICVDEDKIKYLQKQNLFMSTMHKMPCI